MKYKLDKRIMYLNLIICVLLVGTVIYSEGSQVLKSRTETISCPENAMTTCKVRTPTGEILELQKGESRTINEFDQDKLNIVNYGVWIITLKSLIINHLLFNRKYPIRKKLKKLYKTIKETKIEDT